MGEWSATEDGIPGTPSYTISILQRHRDKVSPWHDIPAQVEHDSGNDGGSTNFVCTSARGSSVACHMAVAKNGSLVSEPLGQAHGEPGNGHSSFSTAQDTQDGFFIPSSSHAAASSKSAPRCAWNIGLLPQTFSTSSLFYDWLPSSSQTRLQPTPLNAIDISSRSQSPGNVYAVRAIAILEMSRTRAMDTSGNGISLLVIVMRADDVDGVTAMQGNALKGKVRDVCMWLDAMSEVFHPGLDLDKHAIIRSEKVKHHLDASHIAWAEYYLSLTSSQRTAISPAAPDNRAQNPAYKMQNGSGYSSSPSTPGALEPLSRPSPNGPLPTWTGASTSHIRSRTNSSDLSFVTDDGFLGSAPSPTLQTPGNNAKSSRKSKVTVSFVDSSDCGSEEEGARPKPAGGKEDLVPGMRRAHTMETERSRGLSRRSPGPSPGATDSRQRSMLRTTTGDQEFWKHAEQSVKNAQDGFGEESRPAWDSREARGKLQIQKSGSRDGGNMQHSTAELGGGARNGSIPLNSPVMKQGRLLSPAPRPDSGGTRRSKEGGVLTRAPSGRDHVSEYPVHHINPSDDEKLSQSSSTSLEQNRHKKSSLRGSDTEEEQVQVPLRRLSRTKSAVVEGGKLSESAISAASEPDHSESYLSSTYLDKSAVRDHTAHEGVRPQRHGSVRVVPSRRAGAVAHEPVDEGGSFMATSRLFRKQSMGTQERRASTVGRNSAEGGYGRSGSKRTSLADLFKGVSASSDAPEGTAAFRQQPAERDELSRAQVAAVSKVVKVPACVQAISEKRIYGTDTSKQGASQTHSAKGDLIPRQSQMKGDGGGGGTALRSAVEREREQKLSRDDAGSRSGRGQGEGEGRFHTLRGLRRKPKASILQTDLFDASTPAPAQSPQSRAQPSPKSDGISSFFGYKKKTSTPAHPPTEGVGAMDAMSMTRGRHGRSRSVCQIPDFATDVQDAELLAETLVPQTPKRPTVRGSNGLRRTGSTMGTLFGELSRENPVSNRESGQGPDDLYDRGGGWQTSLETGHHIAA